MSKKKPGGAARPPSVRTGPGLTLEEHDKLLAQKQPVVDKLYQEQPYYIPVTGGMMPTDKRMREVIAAGRYLAAFQVIVRVPEEMDDDARSALEGRVNELQFALQALARGFSEAHDGLEVEVA